MDLDDMVERFEDSRLYYLDYEVRSLVDAYRDDLLEEGALAWLREELEEYFSD